jgi:hypothetical protein
MTSIARTNVGRPLGRLRALRPSLSTVGVCAGAVVIGMGVAAGFGPYIGALLILGAAMALGIRSWRLSILLLLAYIPVSGLFWIALYPDTAPAALAKDFLFVIPAYIGFFGPRLVAKRPIRVPGLPVTALTLLALLVLVQALNPALPAPLVGAVGAKVWLFYIPMAAIGYHLIRRTRDIDTMLNILCLTAVIPAMVGVVEAALVYLGHSTFVYGLYGDAASATTQEFAALNIGGANILRIPSTFSFFLQYYIYMTCMVALGYAWWRRAPAGSGLRAFRVAIWVLFLAAVLTAGARGAFAFIPALLAAILLLEGHVGARGIGVVGALMAGIFASLALIGTDIGALVSHLWDTAVVQFGIVVVSGANQAFDHGLVGLGAGYDTIAARYVVDISQQFGQIGYWQESYWAKSVLELGPAGLILVVAIFVSILRHGFHVHRGLRDPGLKVMSASILALMLWTMAYNVKAQYFDLDPLNIFFWLLTGILFKLPALDRASPPSRVPSDGLDREFVARRSDQRVRRTPAASGESAYPRG